MVDFLADDTPELRAWRAEVRDFLETELPGGFYFDFDFDEDPERWNRYREFWQKVGRRGWIGLTWPKEYYGLGRTAIEYWIMHDEFTRYGVPSMGVIGGAVANHILRVGTHEQKLKHLKGAADFSVIWGEGYSEPQAGSDLAALTTRAQRDGDEWVINGQKAWGTAMHQCNWVAILARTDPNPMRPNDGISCFLVSLDSPGITLQPVHNMAEGIQSQSFYDDLRVPADALLGDEGQAWSQIWFQQGGEKLVAGPYIEGRAGRVIRALAMIKRYARETTRNGIPLDRDPIVRQQLAELELGVELFRLHCHEAYSNAKSGQVHAFNTVLASNLKLAYFKEFWPRFTQTCLEIVGPTSLLQEGPGTIESGHFEHFFRSSFGNHAGGTSQLKRMVMATRGLGLPR